MDNSIVDYLNNTGQASDFNSRAALAKANNIQNYTGSAEQNLALLSSLKNTSNTSKNIVNQTQSTIQPIPLTNLNVAKVDMPQPAPVTPVAPVNMTQTLLESARTELTPEQQQSANLSKNIMSLLGQTAGESQALAEAQKTFGVEEKIKSLSDINNLINLKQADLNQGDIVLAQSLQNIEDKPIALEFITGEQASIQRNAQLARALKASEIGVLNARAVALQGDVALAQSLAQQAVDNKYAPVKESLNIYKAQLDALQPILSAQEKEQSKLWDIKVQLALKDIDERKATEKAKENIITNAASQGAPTSLLNQASQAKNPMQAAIILGQYAGDYYKTELLKQQIATEKAQRSKIYNDVAKTNAEFAALSNTSGARQLSGDALSKFNALPQVKDTQNAVPFRQALSDYKKAIETYGTGELFGAGSGALQESYMRLTGAVKDYYKLGSLDNGVQKLISIGIPEPSLTGLKANRVASLNSAIDSIDKDVANKFKQIESTVYKDTVEYNEIKNQYLQEASKTSVSGFSKETPTNKFSQSLGQQQIIPGTSIINQINNEGVTFTIPQ